MELKLVTLLLLTVVVTVQNYRLSGDTVPTEYNLIITYVSATLYRTELTIKFKTTKVTNKIVLHTRGSTILQSNYDVVATSGTPVISYPATGKALNDGTDQYEIKLDGANVLAAESTYEIVFNIFSTVINTEPAYGFYNSAENSPRFLGLTQFQAIGARRSFPCWDEPGMKATFTLMVIHPASYTVLSSVNGRTTLVGTTFTMPSKISPHTMSWAILQSTVDRTQSPADSRISIYTRNGMTAHSSTALEAAAAAVNQLGTDFNTATRTFSKLDIVATYSTKFPGVNNWGLQFYREADILFIQTDSSTSNLQRIWQLVTHEVSHQWFSDVATFPWWDEVWLSEGIATYFEYFTPLEKWKTWQMVEQFVVQQTQVALQADCHDGLYSPALIRARVNSNKEIEKVFDVISFSKGASIIRMLNLLMGDEKFKAGLRKYLLEGATRNIGSTDLWEQMNSEMPGNVLPNGVPLRDVMKKWSTIPGFPEIKVTRNYIGANNNTVTFEQSQFLLPPYPDQVTGPLWYVPFTLTTENSPTTSTRDWILEEKSKTLSVPLVTRDQWVLLNKDGGGFYRVNYDTENWKLLFAALPKLTITSRAILIDDALNLARGGRLDYSTAFDVMNLLPNETNFVPWSAALNGLGYLYDRLSNDTGTRKVVEEYITEKLVYVYTYVKGFNIGTIETHEFALTRQLILHWACRVNHELCINEAEQQFEAWRISPAPNPNPIDPDVRRVSYCTGMRIGGETEFNLLKSYYESSLIPLPDQPRIIYAMGCSNETDLLAKYLISSINPGPYKRREVFSAVCQNPDGVDVALSFLISHWNYAASAWGGAIEVGKAFSEDLAPKLNTREQLEQLEHLVMFNTLGDAEEGARIAIRTVKETLVWQENYRDDIFLLMGGRWPKKSGTVASSSICIFTLFFGLFLLAANFLL